MGTNQHLVRSILAIRKEGGVRLADGTRLMPDPILAGRNADKLRELARAHGIERWTTDLGKALADRADTVFFDAASTQLRPKLVKQAIAAGKHVYCEKPVATTLAAALDIYRAAKKARVKHGVVQDKLWLPGLLKLKKLADAGFFGRILSVRGEFGYWVFEGDTRHGQPAAQRPSWNYRARRRRRHHPRHAVPLALRPRQPVRRGEGVSPASARRTSRTAGTRTEEVPGDGG